MKKAYLRNSIIVVLATALLIPFTLLGQSADSSSTKKEMEIDGKWLKMQRSKNMGSNIVDINIKKKAVDFMYRGFGFVTLDILKIERDEKVGMPRYFLTVKGLPGLLRVIG